MGSWNGLIPQNWLDGQILLQWQNKSCEYLKFFW
jgi:hypothetical protein